MTPTQSARNSVYRRIKPWLNIIKYPPSRLQKLATTQNGLVPCCRRRCRFLDPSSNKCISHRRLSGKLTSELTRIHVAHPTVWTSEEPSFGAGPHYTTLHYTTLHTTLNTAQYTLHTTHYTSNKSRWYYQINKLTILNSQSLPPHPAP